MREPKKDSRQLNHNLILWVLCFFIGTITHSASAQNECPPSSPGYQKNIEMYSSSYCSYGLLAIANYYTTCNTLSGDSSVVRGIRVEGRCLTIENHSVETTCLLYKAASVHKSILFFRNDYCSSGFVAAVAEKYRCEEISRILDDPIRIGSIWLNGHCVQITNSEFMIACNRFVP